MNAVYAKAVLIAHPLQGERLGKGEKLVQQHCTHTATTAHLWSCTELVVNRRDMEYQSFDSIQSISLRVTGWVGRERNEHRSLTGGGNEG